MIIRDILISSSNVVGFVSSSIPLTNFVPNSGIPNDPVFVARSEAIEKRGGSPFMELSVPDAVIKFRQGIGRLIRRSDDKGVVVVLDRRIIEKTYGSIFMASMPECKKMYEPLSDICKKINTFIFD